MPKTLGLEVSPRVSPKQNPPSPTVTTESGIELTLIQVAEFPPLPESFYFQETLEIARQLLGKGLYIQHGKVRMLAEIVEGEVYLAETDPASHAFRGRTARNWPMFEPGGTCYVYLSYGINLCMNVVTQAKGRAEAILLRAAKPLLGIPEMKKNRGFTEDSASERKLLSGPGKLTQALGVDFSYQGAKFDRPDFKLVDLGVAFSDDLVSRSPRIGISKAKEEPLRYCVRQSPWLSRKA